MLPLVKPNNFVEYKLGSTTFINKVLQSNPTTVWVYDDNGKILKLHKKWHKIKVVEEPKEVKEGKPSKALDDLIKEVKK